MDNPETQNKRKPMDNHGWTIQRQRIRENRWTIKDGQSRDTE